MRCNSDEYGCVNNSHMTLLFMRRHGNPSMEVAPYSKIYSELFGVVSDSIRRAQNGYLCAARRALNFQTKVSELMPNFVFI